jgi:hypothetical protein
MAFLNPARRGFHILYELSADRIWFALAVAVGLFAAHWLAQSLGLGGFPSIYEGIGY